jgi:hypothetical protein
LVEIQAILHMAMGGFFLFLLARDLVGNRAAAMFGGVLYAFGGAMVARTQHVNAVDAMAWSPLIFMLARRGLLYKDMRYSAAAGILFGVQILAGRWQHSAYLGLLLFLYFLYLSRSVALQTLASLDNGVGPRRGDRGGCCDGPDHSLLPARR